LKVVSDQGQRGELIADSGSKETIRLLDVLAMAAVGSLVFCTDCGNLLESSSGDEKTILKCEVCGTENRGKIVLGGSTFPTI